MHANALSIIAHVQQSKNPRITGNKIIGELHNEMIAFKSDLVKRYPKIDPKLFFDKAFCQLVFEGYLKLDFSFGSFSNFTYILPGKKTVEAGSNIEISVRIPLQSKIARPVETIENLNEQIQKKLPVKRRHEETGGDTVKKASKR